MVTLEDIKRLINEETEKLHKVGYYPMPIKTIKIVKAKSFFADAWRELSMIRVSHYFLEAPVEEIRATIMHELIHMVPEAGHGHGFQWKYIAGKVNEAYPQYNIKRVGSQRANGTEWSLRRAAAIQSVKENKPIKKHMVKCTACGLYWERERESNLTLHPEQYHCHCGGRLVRVY